jgi:hypothetical protein
MSDKTIKYLPTLVFRQSKLKGPTKAILAALSSFANKQGLCWPSIAKITESGGFSEATTKKQLRVLEAIGSIQRLPMKNKGKRTSTCYIINTNLIGHEVVTKSTMLEAECPSRRGRMIGMSEYATNEKLIIFNEAMDIIKKSTDVVSERSEAYSDYDEVAEGCF